MTDPNKLVRQAAGSYRTADDRFEVRGQPNRWFLVDTGQVDELGQELVRGPFATLDEVGEAIPEARRADIKPLALPKARGPTRKPKPKPPPPPSWIDKLPPPEAARVRAVIRALERGGVADAENLARRDHDGLAPEVARRLIELRLEALVAELPATERAAAERLVRQVAAVLTTAGARDERGLPGWALVEIGPLPAPPNRRITLDT